MITYGCMEAAIQNAMKAMRGSMRKKRKTKDVKQMGAR